MKNTKNAEAEVKAATETNPEAMTVAAIRSELRTKHGMKVGNQQKPQLIEMLLLARDIDSANSDAEVKPLEIEIPQPAKKTAKKPVVKTLAWKRFCGPDGAMCDEPIQNPDELLALQTLVDAKKPGIELLPGDKINLPTFVLTPVKEPKPKTVKVKVPAKRTTIQKMGLTQKEFAVLEAMVPSSAGNGHDFGFVDEVDYKSLDLKRQAYAALVGHLVEKKIVELWDEEVQGERKGQTKTMHAFLFAAPIREALASGRPLTDYFEVTADGKNPAPEKVAPKKAEKTTEPKPENRRNKVGVIAKWIELFEANENNFRAGKLKKVLVDAEIAQAMREAFPDRPSKVFDQVAMVRGRYNRGILSKGVRPAVDLLSHRFTKDEKGNAVLATARGLAIA